jgi:hypothetical protein
MTGRVLLAGILGGIAMFIWGFIAHVVLPLGEYGVSTFSNEQGILESVHTATGGKDGLYVAPAKMEPGATASPTVFMAYRTSVSMTEDLSSMLPQMLSNLGITIVASIILAGVLGAMAVGFAARVAWSAAAGLMASLVTDGPYHVWYGFPVDYTLAQIVEIVVCFLVAGIVIALVLPKDRAVNA